MGARGNSIKCAVVTMALVTIFSGEFAGARTPTPDDPPGRSSDAEHPLAPELDALRTIRTNPRYSVAAGDKPEDVQTHREVVERTLKTLEGMPDSLALRGLRDKLATFTDPNDRLEILSGFADHVRAGEDPGEFVSRLGTGRGSPTSTTRPNPLTVTDKPSPPGPVPPGEGPRAKVTPPEPPRADPPRADPPRTDPPRAEPPTRTGDGAKPAEPPTRTADTARPADAPKPAEAPVARGPIGISTDPSPASRGDVIGPSLGGSPNEAPILLGRHRGGDLETPADPGRGGSGVKTFLLTEADKNAPLLSMPLDFAGALAAGGARGGANGTEQRKPGESDRGGLGGDTVGEAVASAGGTAASRGAKGDDAAEAKIEGSLVAGSGTNGAKPRDADAEIVPVKAGPSSFLAYLGKESASTAIAGGTPDGSGTGKPASSLAGAKKGSLAGLAALAAAESASGQRMRGMLAGAVDQLSQLAKRGAEQVHAAASRFAKPLVAALAAWDEAGPQAGARHLMAGVLADPVAAGMGALGLGLSVLLTVMAHRRGWRVALLRNFRRKSEEDTEYEKQAA